MEMVVTNSLVLELLFEILELIRLMPIVEIGVINRVGEVQTEMKKKNNKLNFWVKFNAVLGRFQSLRIGTCKAFSFRNYLENRN